MSFSKIASFVTLAAIVAPALAHIEMKNPPPLRSAFNPQYKDGPIQDTYTNPLNKDGSNYPCKGFAGDVPSMSHAVATLNAGSNFTVELAGSAVHGGGSCQFAVSYNGGKDWGVLHSIVGGCPTENASYSFMVPSGLPAGKDVLFAWTWFNYIGNREMYMNCAAVDVMSGATGSVELPRMFEANHFADQCVTPEGSDVDFAAPKLNNCPDGMLVTPDMKVTIGSGPAAPMPASTTPPMSSSMPPVSSSAPPATQTGGGSMPPTSGAGAWASDKVFMSGDAACYNGKSYTAKWWTMGETPGSAEVWGAAGAAC